MIKEIFIQISVRYIIAGNKTFQQFNILGSKFFCRYITDIRFLLHDKFENTLLKHSLSNKYPNIFTYSGRTEYSMNNGIHKVVLEFDGRLDELLTDYFFTISDFVPKVFGCEYCRFNEKEEERIKCGFYGKFVKKRLKSCKYFKQKQLFKT